MDGMTGEEFATGSALDWLACITRMEFSNLVRAEEPNVLVEFREPNPEDPAGGGELSKLHKPNNDDVQPNDILVNLTRLGAALPVVANPILS